MTRAEAIQKYGSYGKGNWKNEDKFITDYHVAKSITSDPNNNMRWDNALPEIGGNSCYTFFYK